MEELKEEDEGEYNIYGLGMWGVSGGTFFNKHSVNKRILEVNKLIADNVLPVKRGRYEFDYVNHEIVESTIRWVDDEDGYIKIYKNVEVGHPYVLGCDTAGDKGSGLDMSVGIVVDNYTKEDIATVSMKIDEDLFARQLYCLGREYNDALMAIETNWSTHPLKEVQRLGYTNLYYREEAPDTITNNYIKKYGYVTGKLTRPQALGMLRQLVREEPEKIVSIDLLDEMTTFVKNPSKKDRPEAMNGCHDDFVMARGIACYASPQQINYVDVVRMQPKIIDDDEDDDYEYEESGFY